MIAAFLSTFASFAAGPVTTPATTNPASRLEIVSDSACPDAPMIRAALDGLGGAEPRRPARVQVRTAANGLSLEFQWDGEGDVDRRELPTSADCEERASAAATVAAAWLGVLPVSPPSSLNRIPKPDAAPPVAAVTPVTSQAGVAPPQPASPSVAPPPWWLGVGLGAGVGGGIAVGARLELARTPASGTGFGWMVGAETTLPRERAVAGATSRWLRPALEAGARAVWQGERVGLALDLGGAAGVTVAWGQGYANDARDQAMAWGALGGLRLGFGQGSTQSWLELRAVKWLTAHRLRVDASSAPVTAELPGFEAFLTVGWSLRIF